MNFPESLRFPLRYVHAETTMKKTARRQNAALVTIQDVFHILALIAISLLFWSMPMYASGQPLGSVTHDAIPGFDMLPPPVPAIPEQAAAMFPAMTPLNPPLNPPLESAVPPVPVEDFYAPVQVQLQAQAPQELPEPAAATVSPMTASQFTPVQSQPYQPPLLRNPQSTTAAAVSAEHPFAKYWGIPNDSQTQITGKPMTVTALLSGTRSPIVRRQLLQAYWDLSGLLAIYHFRLENERLAGGMQQDSAGTLLREQRRTAEVEFIKQQWVLAGLLNQFKGRPLRESELPIPEDFPLYPRYQTFADQIARSERTQYLGRMIPIQEQLIESKNGTWKAASEMVQSASHPPFVVSTQRTMAFLDLTRAVIEYNQMIAEYALETIPPNVSHQQLVGAVVRLPRTDESPQSAINRRQSATQPVAIAHNEEPANMAAQPVMQAGYEYPSLSAPMMVRER